MFSKILLATDFSKASHAVLHAGISIGSRCLAALEAVHVVTFLEDVNEAARHFVPGSEWHGQMEGRFESYFPANLYPNSRRLVLTGRSIPDEILKHARNEKCDLIIAGSHGRSVGHLLVGSVTQHLTRSSEIPVMIVRGVENVEAPYQGFKNILAPTDFSDASDRALGFAARFANFLSGDLHLIHVFNEPVFSEFQTAYPVIEVKMPQPSDVNVNPRLRSLLEPLKLVGESKVATLAGDPVKEILAYSEEHHADFIVMGTHGKTGLERILLGSVTAGVISKSGIPVITLR